MIDANPYQENNFYLDNISTIAGALHLLKDKKQVLLDSINRLSNESVVTILERYADSNGPVNSLRFEVAKKISEKEELSFEFLDKRIQEIEKENDRRSFRAYDYFSILFPFMQVGVKFNVKEALTELSTEIMSRLKLDDLGKIHSVDFWGPRGFGDVRAWTVIYNNSHRSHQTAKQLFINIDIRGLNIGVYDRAKQEFLDEKLISINGETVNEIVRFFESYADVIREDDYEKANFLSLGVKDAKFYKLSHGKLFTPNQIQDCLDANIAVVHEGGSSEGQTSPLEYETFANAQKGDLFYCCWGIKQLLIVGQFVDDEIRDFSLALSPKGWKERSYRIIQQVQIEESFRGPKRKWTPNDSSTFVEVSESDYTLLNEVILRPYFQTELDTSKSTPVPESKIGISSQKEIRVLDSKVGPKLDVKIVAQEFANIIDNLEDNKGQMLGVFGSWGRGKTFFVDCVKEEFSLNRIKKKYINVTFNAWKYQETEAIWAYLYEIMVDTYFADGVREKSPKVWKKLVIKWRTFILNFKRKGYTKFFGIFIGFIASLYITYFISSRIKLDFANYLITAIGAIGLIQAYVLYRRYYQGIKDVLNDYSSRNSYRSVLGFQAEIQDELIILIKHWLKRKDDRRILLFVDDLDRCNEGKIIQIIDALRVMLDNEHLVKKLIIIVAVDELLLERAIKLKYQDFKVDDEKENLVQEYMDKLFIAGIKFPSLYQEEQAVILENYAIKGGILESISITTEEKIKENSKRLNIVSLEEQKSGFAFPEPDLFGEKSIESEFFLLRSELELLQTYSNEISTNVTPRGLRIYMYRYLLSKNLASTYMSKGTRYQLEDQVCELLAEAIAKKSSNPLFSIDDLEKFKSVENQKLRDFIPKLIDMVVPY